MTKAEELKEFWCPRCGCPGAFLTRVFLIKAVGVTEDGLPMERVTETSEERVVCVTC